MDEPCIAGDRRDSRLDSVVIGRVGRSEDAARENDLDRQPRQSSPASESRRHRDQLVGAPLLDALLTANQGYVPAFAGSLTR